MPRFESKFSWDTILVALALIFSVGGACAYVIERQARSEVAITALEKADVRIEAATQANDATLRQDIGEFRLEMRDAIKELRKDLRRSK